jgi:hypothetical protein
MRNAMARLNAKRNYIFVGKYKGVAQENKYAVFKDVKIYDANTQEYKGRVNHLLLQRKVFRICGVKYKDIVRFTGKPITYRRMDYSIDYTVKINKIKSINGVDIPKPMC